MIAAGGEDLGENVLASQLQDSNIPTTSTPDNEGIVLCLNLNLYQIYTYERTIN